MFLFMSEKETTPKALGLSDILDQILVRLDVPDVIRCKTVLKSWRSCISSPYFIKNHLNHSYNRDRTNNENVNRRILMEWTPHIVPSFLCDDHDSYLLGSSNGLVCLYTPDADILVANSCTREFQLLQKIVIPDFAFQLLQKIVIPDFASCCWGFRHDSANNVYNVLVGIRNVGQKGGICFYMLTSDTNVWKFIGEVSYGFITRFGILCNGALHWLMTHSQSNNKIVILSFRLSSEEFVEIPQPLNWPGSQVNDEDKEGLGLGITGECLCVFRYSRSSHLNPDDIMIMNKYNLYESWGKMEHGLEINKEAVHCLGRLEKDVPYDKSLRHLVIYERDLDLISAPIFVQSLVSPCFHHTHDQQNSKLMVVVTTPTVYF